MSHDPQTLAFYGREAAAYASRPRRKENTGLSAFLSRLAPNAHVLDLGCGGGHDAKAMIKSGYRVTAMDGAPELAAQAARLIGRPVRVQLFEHLEDIEAFDAVWANASLLHVPKSALGAILQRIWRALKPGGLLFASFKSGRVEGRDDLGRYYNHPDKDELAALLSDRAWADFELQVGTGPGYDGVVTDWLSFTVTKAGPLANSQSTG